MKKIINKTFYRSLILSLAFLLTPVVSSARLNTDLVAYKVQFKQPGLGQKLAISYHHALLSAHYEKGYVIADLNSQERADLITQGFVIELASDWNKKVKSFEIALMGKNDTLLDEDVNSESLNKPIADFKCYPTVEETYQTAAQLALDNPHLAKWVDIGDSWQKTSGQGGYDIKVLQITNQTIDTEKPILFIHSSMHAREYTPAALTLSFAKQLLNGYHTNADHQWIIDHHEVHIVFQMNPDGRKVAEQHIYQRKNMNQSHCPDSWTGVDLNRNFAFSWNKVAGGSSGESCEQTFRGDSPDSEPETQAVANYVRSLYTDRRGPSDNDPAPLNTSGLHLDIHSSGGLILWPYGHTGAASPNGEQFKRLGNKLAWFNNYAPMQSIGLYATDGTSDAVSYGELGVAAITFELGTEFFEPCSNFSQSILPDNLKALTYAAKIAAAPYQLPFGPDVTHISINGLSSGIEVSGQDANLDVTVSSLQTKLTTADKSISRLQYSIDSPVWQTNTQQQFLLANTADSDKSVINFNGKLDLQGLAIGKHILYLRGINKSQQPGAVSAVFFNLVENNPPAAIINSSCQGLTCQFDASDSNDSDGNITTFEWVINNSENLSGSQVSYQFSQAGAHTVTLTVSDNQSATHSVTRQVNVTAPTANDNSASGSSGGGSFYFSWLLGFMVLVIINSVTAINLKRNVNPQ